MNEADYQQNFPAGVTVPELLRALFTFQSQSKSWYSGYFQLHKWQFGNAAWFGGDREAAEQFAVIGRGPDGSLYALWLYPGRTTEDAPVVFLGSEGTDSSLLAGSIRDFMALLAVGVDELGFAASWGNVVQPNRPAERLEEFRLWLDSNFGIVTPALPDTLIAAGRANHPDFATWLNTWFASKVNVR